MTVSKAPGELDRSRIMRLLLKEQLGVNEVAARFDISPYNASKYLRVLRETSLPVAEQQGKPRRYAVAPGLEGQLAANAKVLELDCCTFRFDKLPR